MEKIERLREMLGTIDPEMDAPKKRRVQGAEGQGQEGVVVVESRGQEVAHQRQEAEGREELIRELRREVEDQKAERSREAEAFQRQLTDLQLIIEQKDETMLDLHDQLIEAKKGETRHEEAFLSLQNELSETNSFYKQQTVDHLEVIRDSFQMIAKMGKGLDYLRNQLIEAKQTIDRMGLSINELRNELLESKSASAQKCVSSRSLESQTEVDESQQIVIESQQIVIESQQIIDQNRVEITELKNQLSGVIKVIAEKEKAIKALEKKDKKGKCPNGYSEVLDSKNEAIKKLEDTIKSVRCELIEANTKYSKEIRSHVEAQKEQKELFERSEKTVGGLLAELDESKRMIKEKMEEIQGLQMELDRTKQNGAERNKNEADVETELSRSRQIITELEQKTTGLEIRLKDSQNQLGQLQESKDGLQRDLNEITVSFEKKTQKMKDLELEKAGAKKKIADLKRSLTEASKSLAERNKLIRLLNKEVAGASERVKLLSATICEGTQKDLLECREELEEAVEMLIMAGDMELVLSNAKNEKLVEKITPKQGNLVGKDNLGKFEYVGGILNGLRHGLGVSKYADFKENGCYRKGLSHGRMKYLSDNWKADKLFNNGVMEWGIQMWKGGAIRLSRYKLKQNSTVVMEISKDKQEMAFAKCDGLNWMDSTWLHFSLVQSKADLVKYADAEINR